MTFNKKNSGFTLVELSIVLIVIALVIAGVLTGQTLIKNAKLISVYDDITKFTNAFNTFRDSYKAIPGDLKFLPGASFNDVEPTGGVGARNNGAIEWNVDLTSGTNKTTESTLFWQHLFIAGLNDFNPIFSSDPSIQFEEGKETAPKSKIQGAGYKPESYLSDNFSNSRYRIIFQASNALYPTTPVLSAGDAFFLDSKYDDGKPLTGSIWFIASSWLSFPPYTDCLVSGNQDYKVDNATADKKSCMLVFSLPK